MASREEWETRVAAWRSSNLTARAYCAEHGHAVSSLYLWASKLRRQNEHQASRGAVKLARVVREKPTYAGDLVIEVGALRVSMSAATDRDVVITVLTTLAEAAAP